MNLSVYKLHIHQLKKSFYNGRTMGNSLSHDYKLIVSFKKNDTN